MLPNDPEHRAVIHMYAWDTDIIAYECHNHKEGLVCTSCIDSSSWIGNDLTVRSFASYLCPYGPYEIGKECILVSDWDQYDISADFCE